ncbi:hypothetical protein [Sinorhizobium sp. BG8]|nr:hypothetical protein [Sinorhizobium sp. BG8]
MRYQWDEAQAKRDRRWKLASIVTATLFTVGVPTAMIFAALRY